MKLNIIALSLILISTLSFCQNKDEKSASTSIYDISINSLSGDKIDLNDYKGKKILFVNVASKCGFTPQYADLQKLHEKYKKKLVIIGVPCNQFGGQEPGTAEEIQNFCTKNYGVEFLITEKVDVKGENQHPLYKWLTEKELNGLENSSVKWNFQKYIIDEKGNFVDFFYSLTNPMSKKITELI